MTVRVFRATFAGLGVPKFLVLLAMLSTTGCVTKYAPLSGKGGYIELPAGADKYDVSFSGNGMVPPDLMETYLLYRCAEVTQSVGKRYFISEERTNEPPPGSAALPQYSKATIKVLAEEPKGKGSEYYDAALLMQQLGPYVEKKDD